MILIHQVSGMLLFTVWVLEIFKSTNTTPQRKQNHSRSGGPETAGKCPRLFVEN